MKARETMYVLREVREWVSVRLGSLGLCVKCIDRQIGVRER